MAWTFLIDKLNEFLFKSSFQILERIDLFPVDLRLHLVVPELVAVQGHFTTGKIGLLWVFLRDEQSLKGQIQQWLWAWKHGLSLAQTPLPVAYQSRALKIP